MLWICMGEHFVMRYESRDYEHNLSDYVSDLRPPGSGNLPTEYCVIAYDCKKCGRHLHPEGDDCCVYCTHGDHKCPSKQ